MNKKIRYAVVGLGHIAQDAILPAFKNAKKNSELTALVSGNPKKLKVLGKHYKVKNLYSYDEYGDCLRSGKIDAVYIALPNDQHRKYTEQAARAGIHVLCEKPLSISAQDCQSMIDISKQNKIKLMTAYRLHFEEANLKAVETVRSGQIGEPKMFSSLFCMPVKDHNIRLNPRDKGGGPVYDIGIYCLNAARSIFQSEPIDVTAVSIKSQKEPFKNIEDTVSVIMRFPKEKIATFTCSFDGASVGNFRVVGTKGDLFVKNAFDYEGPKYHRLTVGNKAKVTVFKARDHFAPELLYFSECILKNKEPEPSGLEGLADVRIIEAIFASIDSGDSEDTGRTVPVKGILKRDYPTLDQEKRAPQIKAPNLVDAEEPSGEEAA